MDESRQVQDPLAASDRENSDESLASVPPQPLQAHVENAGCGFTANAALLAAAGAGAFFLLAGTMTPCVGATRSAKLKWQERQLQIEQAVSDLNASRTEAE